MIQDQDISELLKRIEALEVENESLRARLSLESSAERGLVENAQLHLHQSGRSPSSQSQSQPSSQSQSQPSSQSQSQPQSELVRSELESAYAMLLTEVIGLRQQEQNSREQISFLQKQHQLIQQRADQLEKATDVLKQSLLRLATDEDLYGFLGHVLIEIIHQARADSGHVFLYDAQAHTLNLCFSIRDGQIHYGAKPDEPPLFHAPIAADLTPAFQYLCDQRSMLSLNDHEFRAMAWPGTLEWFRRDQVAEAICLALMAGDRPVGLLGLRFLTKAELQQKEIELIDALAQQATLAIELTRLSDKARQAAIAQEQEKAAQDRAAELAKANESLKRSLNRLATDSNLDSFLTSILQEALRIIRGKQAQIFFYDAETEMLTPSAGISGHGEEIIPAPGVIADVPEINHPFPPNITGGWQRLVKHRFPIYFDLERDTDDFWPGTIEWHRSHGNQGVICIALMLGDQPLGMLGITMPRLSEPTDAEYEFFQALSQQATLAIQLTRLAEEAQQAAILKEREKAAQEQVAELTKANEFLQSSLQKLAGEPELERFLGHMLTVCCERFGAQEAGIWRNEEGVFRLFVAYENQSIKLRNDISHPGANLAIAQNMRNHQVLTQLRKRELVIDHEEDFETAEVYEQFRDYFKQRGIKSVIKVPMFLGDVLHGILVLRFGDRHILQPEEAELAYALANQAVLALELTRLAEVAQKAAIVEERNRMARDIHDNLAQIFTSILMRLQTAGLTLPEGDQASQEHINRACDLAREGLASARRSVHALRPELLENRSFARALAGCLQQMISGTDIRHEVRTVGDSSHLPEAIESELFHIGQEAITNACKHSQARKICIEITFLPHQVRLSVKDDGIGFSPMPLSTQNGFGLISMRERTKRLGGQMTIRSHPGEGTDVIVVVPL